MSNNIYLLNEDTKFQLGCNDVCRRIYNHLASLHRNNGLYRWVLQRTKTARI